MKFTKKRILAAALSFSLILSSLPVFAQEDISSSEPQTNTEQTEIFDSKDVISESDASLNSQEALQTTPNQEDLTDTAETPVTDQEKLPDVIEENKETSSSENHSASEASFDDTDVSFDDGSGKYHDREMSVNDAGETEADIEIIDTPAPAERSTNTPPVAGLVYVVLNPETLVNGQISTATQIAWLWSYNGENYTYDPDGDAITNISIGGIPSDSIIGSMSGNIGFATQFSTPGQYQMTYQVTDARGAKSNILKLVFNVEPVVGNTRPIMQAVFAPQDGRVYVSSPSAVISWKNSYDNDAGDYIADVRGLVYKDGSETSENISKYISSTNANEKYIQLSFSSIGNYEVWFSVSDSHGAWSDWALHTYIVSERPHPIVKELNYGNTMVGKWFNYPKSIELAEAGESEESILAQLETTLPSPLDCQVGAGDQVSGKIEYSDGSPVANTKVTLNMPVPNADPFVYITTTNSSGYFEMSWTIQEYYASLYGKRYRPGQPNGKYGEWAHAAFDYTTFMSPTELTITCAGAVKTVPVCAITGGAPFILVGETVTL